MSLEISGTVKLITPEEEVGAKKFKKRLIVITTNETYPQDLPIEFTQERTDMLDYYKEGENVKVAINLRGSEYLGRWYLSANGWKIEKI